MCFAATALGCGTVGRDDDEHRRAETTVVGTDPVAPVPSAVWPTGDPGEHGLDPARLEDVAAYLDDFGSNCLAVIKDGYLVDARYWRGTTPTTDQEVFSITKSITSTLVGIAQDRGLVDIDEPASKYIQEWRGTDSETVTIENLLSMVSGRQYDPQKDLMDIAVNADDKRAFSIALGQQDPPGQRWVYNDAGVQILGEVLERATGRSVDDFARTALLEPLGMTATMIDDRAGHTMTFMGLQADCLDIARFGYLALRGGTWGSEQIVSRAWFEDATKSSQEVMTPYGYLWWLNANGRRQTRAGDVVDDGTYFLPDAPTDAFAAVGTASQVLVVVPSEDLVVVRLGPGDSPNEPEVVANEILRLLLPQ